MLDGLALGEIVGRLVGPSEGVEDGSAVVGVLLGAGDLVGFIDG